MLALEGFLIILYRRFPVSSRAPQLVVAGRHLRSQSEQRIQNALDELAPRSIMLWTPFSKIPSPTKKQWHHLLKFVFELFLESDAWRHIMHQTHIFIMGHRPAAQKHQLLQCILTFEKTPSTLFPPTSAFAMTYELLCKNSYNGLYSGCKCLALVGSPRWHQVAPLK